MKLKTRLWTAFLLFACSLAQPKLGACKNYEDESLSREARVFTQYLLDQEIPYVILSKETFNLERLESRYIILVDSEKVGPIAQIPFKSFSQRKRDSRAWENLSTLGSLLALMGAGTACYQINKPSYRTQAPTEDKFYKRYFSFADKNGQIQHRSEIDPTFSVPACAVMFGFAIQFKPAATSILKKIRKRGLNMKNIADSQFQERVLSIPGPQFELLRDGLIKDHSYSKVSR